MNFNGRDQLFNPPIFRAWPNVQRPLKAPYWCTLHIQSVTVSIMLPGILEGTWIWCFMKPFVLLSTDDAIQMTIDRHRTGTRISFHYPCMIASAIFRFDSLQNDSNKCAAFDSISFVSFFYSNLWSPFVSGDRQQNLRLTLAFLLVLLGQKYLLLPAQVENKERV